MSEQEQTPGEELLRWHNFGERLAKRRLELGYTQVYVAGRAGISTQNLVSLEHGGFRRRAGGPWILPNPKDDTLRALARIYRVSPEEMFERVGRHGDRPQTKSALRRRAGLDRPTSRDRIAEVEERLQALERDLAAMRARSDEMERRLREEGSGQSASTERPRRRRASG
jgi:transcriptional regulator with XRE-family HTH domain